MGQPGSSVSSRLGINNFWNYQTNSMVSRRGKIFFNYYNSILILKFFFRYGFLFKLNMRISKLFHNNYSFLVKKLKKSRFRYFKLKRKKLLYSKKEMMLIKRPKTLKFFSQF